MSTFFADMLLGRLPTGPATPPGARQELLLRRKAPRPLPIAEEDEPDDDVESSPRPVRGFYDPVRRRRAGHLVVRAIKAVVCETPTGCFYIHEAVSQRGGLGHISRDVIRHHLKIMVSTGELQCIPIRGQRGHMVRGYFWGVK